MQNNQQERLEFQEKYGIQKDYISLSKEDKKKQAADEVIEFNNKNLISYLEDKYQVEDTEKVKEDKAKAIVKSCFMIQSGFNVCLHGYGSKRQIIQEISDQFINYPKLIIQGYSAATQIQQILQKLKYIVVKITGQNSGQKRIEGILEYLKQQEENMGKISSQVPFILILFHNIDSKQFIEQDSVKILSAVLNLPYIKAVCSIDHVKYPIILTSKVLESFNFSFIEVHTHQCYLHEFKVSQNTFNLKKEKEGESLKYIFRSLTKVQKEIIQFVAKYIQDKLDQNPGTAIQINGLTEDGQIIGLTLKELLEMLIDEMILNSEQQLKENLLEILDHKVIISIENQQKTYYTMNFSRQILEKIVNNKLEDGEEDQEQEEEEENNSVKDMEEENQIISNSQNSSQSEDEDVKGKKKYRQTRREGKKKKNSSESLSDSENEKHKFNKKTSGILKTKNKQQKNKKSSFTSQSSEEDGDDDSYQN
ncbi:origin recognition complex subunit 2 (macronuclear) [Tetrahymena thermophila SB210]|uniref:Origin recognition complex subunit 2 n=1 Tax=Tetrahymena thermophila (strain SB210) TaxID=312017 RepID=I7MJ06_TETTS|nr:origin recognition complex subunit 2 [Tetrahymena thermophila SB210]EAS04912.2 origin recognition complex subunit 2 [Tetrahymena thermophila SB210]|eukprot:XP_001025157.2 origin recognition complex subunit 2 [Tetrahymena thermophila SB210]